MRRLRVLEGSDSGGGSGRAPKATAPNQGLHFYAQAAAFRTSVFPGGLWDGPLGVFPNWDILFCAQAADFRGV